MFCLVADLRRSRFTRKEVFVGNRQAVLVGCAAAVTELLTLVTLYRLIGRMIAQDNLRRILQLICAIGAVVVRITTAHSLMAADGSRRVRLSVVAMCIR